jgi:hypothetical protein
MITRENFPICAKNSSIAINVTSAGDIPKERTSLPFDAENPIPWADETPQAIKEAFPGGPQEAIRHSLGVLYESDEHQYRLGTMIRPEPLDGESV